MTAKTPGTIRVVEMSQSASFKKENQQVVVPRNLYQFALDIPWAFTYHTQARDQEVRGKCVSLGLG